LGSVSRPNFLFKNKKGSNINELGFEDISNSAGFDEPSVSQGAAYADFDNDGDLDLMVNNMNQKAFVMRNEIRKSKKDTSHNFVKIRFQGNSKNRDGFGAKVRLFVAGQKLYGEQYPVRGYASTVDNRMHFGIGKALSIDSLQVVWPSGKSQVLKNISSNLEVLLDESHANTLVNLPFSDSKNDPHLFTEISENPLFKHQEVPFFDYYNRRLQPQKFSQLGPCLAKGDINGDGLEDVIIGGAAYQSAKFFLQNKSGSYISYDLDSPSKFEEDLAIEVFDADRDSDLDILIVGGSTEYQREVKSSPRLYLNNGKAIPKFVKSTTAFPSNLSVFSSTIAAHDFDSDGDIDVFIGGRINKENFPEIPKSYLLINNNGVFNDGTSKICPDLMHVGMITDALWMDFDGDRILDLVLAGEYMPIKIFKNSIKSLKINKNDFKSGMWRSLATADIDNDGDLDIVAGNIGINNKYHVSSDKPFKLFGKDLDNSGTVELLPAYYIKNATGNYDLYPDFDRYQIAEQTPIIKRKYLLHSGFSKATMSQLLDDLGRENLLEFGYESGTSVWYENQGSAKFLVHDLPIEAQFAPINSILVNDFDFDGKMDLLLGGNEYQTEVSTGRTDASNGLFLKGIDKKKFETKTSGFWIEGDLRALILSQNKIWAATNNDNLKRFMINGKK
jgi:enediyne biosynthesis protein E4